MKLSAEESWVNYSVSGRYLQRSLKAGELAQIAAVSDQEKPYRE